MKPGNVLVTPATVAGVNLRGMVLDHNRRPLMDLSGTRKFRLSKRSLTVIIPLVTLLVVSVFWNLRQSQLIAKEQARVRAAQQAETARLKEEADRVEARGKGMPSGQVRMRGYSNCIAKSTLSRGLMNRFLRVRKSRRSHHRRSITRQRQLPFHELGCSTPWTNSLLCGRLSTNAMAGGQSAGKIIREVHGMP